MTEYAYYVVWKVGGDAPTAKHFSYEAARFEAERLARKLGGRFIILHAVGEVIKADVYHDRYLIYEPYNDMDVPF